eukprot:13260710-Alexandrium_andersonii.AAC.1
MALLGRAGSLDWLASPLRSPGPGAGEGGLASLASLGTFEFDEAEEAGGVPGGGAAGSAAGPAADGSPVDSNPVDPFLEMYVWGTIHP